MWNECKKETGSNTPMPLPCGTDEEYEELKKDQPPPPAPGSDLTVA
jgi:hypothetical protein